MPTVAKEMERHLSKDIPPHCQKVALFAVMHQPVRGRMVNNCA